MSGIKLIKISEILNMNFFIPDYQRGYRWEPQQALELLNDIEEFSNKADRGDEEIYCIQPLVVKKRDEEKLFNKIQSEAKSLSEVENLLKNRSWDVVDGQQRLTTIFIILSILNSKSHDADSFSIEYQTRDGSSDALKKLNSMSDEEKKSNIDYYHMKNVYDKASEWLENHNDTINVFKNVLMNSVCFIWYEIPETDDAISVFTRLNIGKIPLTDAELIKALFLNRTNFGGSNEEMEKVQHNIAVQWDEIECALQNDEFWLFLHEKNYSKPTRIDFILELIQKNDKYELYEDPYNTRGNNRKRILEDNRRLTEKIGNDEHQTFRYFYELFNRNKEKDEKWVLDNWKLIRKYYQIFDEWYHDYLLYHYLGFLLATGKSDIGELVENWGNKSKTDFIIGIKRKIKEKVFTDKNLNNATILQSYIFETNGNLSKRECLPILLLHNIETIVQQNKKLIEESKYNLPNFTKFPFHLYKSEKWDIEHISPASGDRFSRDSDKKLFLKLAEGYIPDEEIKKSIDSYLKSQKTDNSSEFADLITKVADYEDSLSGDDKNRIWNYTLLDESTNREYQNAIFPVKRACLSNKENGYKTKVSDTGTIIPDLNAKRIAFIPPCTKNVFMKFYTAIPNNLTNWSKKDAKAYLEDILQKLDFYLKEDSHEQ